MSNLSRLLASQIRVEVGMQRQEAPTIARRKAGEIENFRRSFLRRCCFHEIRLASIDRSPSFEKIHGVYTGCFLANSTSLLAVKELQILIMDEGVISC